jgi:hypothetical protein
MALSDLPLRVQVSLSLGRALWGVPTPALRAVTVSWDEKWLKPRFVYDQPPSEIERDLVSASATELVADFTAHKVDESWEVIPWPEPLHLQPGEAWAFLRYEPPQEPALTSLI